MIHTTTRVIYDILGWEIDPVYTAEIIRETFQREPVGMTGLCLTLVGLLLGLTYKLLDIWWDVYKDKSRQGRLKLEVSADAGEGVIFSVSNIGKEPVVVRQIGYLGNHAFSRRFIPLVPYDHPLPKTLHSKEIIDVTVQRDVDFVFNNRQPAVKDSTGRIWPGTFSHAATAKRELKRYLSSRQQQAAAQATPELTRV